MRRLVVTWRKTICVWLERTRERARACETWKSKWNLLNAGMETVATEISRRETGDVRHICLYYVVLIYMGERRKNTALPHLTRRLISNHAANQTENWFLRTIFIFHLISAVAHELKLFSILSNHGSGAVCAVCAWIYHHSPHIPMSVPHAHDRRDRICMCVMDTKCETIENMQPTHVALVRVLLLVVVAVFVCVANFTI